MSRRPTLNQERRFLTRLRQTAQEAPQSAIDRILIERLGVAAADQVKAASVEAERVLAPEVQARFDLPHKGLVESLDMKAAVLAALIRCFAGAHCEHALTGGRPLLAFPGARVITCRHCLLRFCRQLAAADDRNARRAGEGRLCDFCLEEPADFWFRTSSVHYGPALVIGDMCLACCQQAGRRAEGRPAG